MYYQTLDTCISLVVRYEQRRGEGMKKIELISLAVEPDLKEAIQEEAEKQERSVSSLIRILIKQALEGAETEKK